MKFSPGILSLAATLAITATFPGSANARQPGQQAQRVQNARASADLRARIRTTEQRIAGGLRDGAITPAGATALRRQVTGTQTSMTRLSRQQGFVSAAELASYSRVLGMVDMELDRRGVARNYGNDGLVATNVNTDTAGFQYDCQNEPIDIAIPGDRLDHALAQLRLVSRCPISGTRLAGGKRSRPVAGTMTPTAALQAMLNGTGLQMRSIRQGFEIVRLPRR